MCCTQYICIYFLAEYQNYDDARQSEDYIKEIERLDSTLLPRVRSHFGFGSRWRRANLRESKSTV